MIFDPKMTNFKMLKMLAYVVTFLGLLLIMGVVFVYVFLLVAGENVGLSHFPSYLIYGIPLLVSGQLLYWFVAMWETTVETNKMLKEIARQSQHSKSLNTDTGDAGVG